MGAGDLEDMLLILPGRRAVSVQVKAFTTPPQPSVIDELVRAQQARHPEKKLLAVVPHSTAHLNDLAFRSALNLIAVDENLVVIGGAVYSEETEPGVVPLREPAPVRRGRRPWLRWALERILLLSNSPVLLSDLANRMHSSPQAVSKALKGHEFIQRGDDGWIVDRRADLLDRFLREYPGPGGASTYWYGLDAPMRQAVQVRQFCSEMDVGSLSTGDIAADHFSPWRLPVIAAVYTRELLDFVPARFTVASRGEHTMVATVPEDLTIWRTATAFAGRNAEFVDPVLALHDVTRGQGTDALEAAEHLRNAILTSTLRT